VAGAAALLLSAQPSYSVEQLRSALEARAVDQGHPGKDTQFGYGRLYLGDPAVLPPPAPSTGRYFYLPLIIK
jgi:hypothetical protein